MGNSQQGLASSNVLNHLSKRFVISPHPLDPEQSTMFYLHEKLSDNKYILSIISTNDTDDKQKIEDLICKKLAMNKNISNKTKTYASLIPIDYYLFQQDKGYCNSFAKCYLIFDLKNSQPLAHFLVRETYSQNNSNFMTEEIVYRGLLNLIEGVALLKFYSHPHRRINCDTVYYDKEQNTFLLGDPWISPLTDLQEQYHSPQKLLQMKNQIQKHDPYLADLFSIGMVGLKILGHHNLLEYYTIHKTIDQKGLTRLAQSIKNVNLRTLIMRLLSQNTQIRKDVLTQVKNNTNQMMKLRDSQTSGTKTRNLSGKVASVRKSFVNQTRPISKQYFVLDNKNNQSQAQAQYQNILIRDNQNNLSNYPYSKQQNPLQANPFIKIKQAPHLGSHSSLKIFPPFQPHNNIISNPPFKATTSSLFNMQLMNDKPDIDIGITKNKLPNQLYSNINPIPSYKNPVSTIPSYLPQTLNYPSSSYQYPNKNIGVTFNNNPPTIPTYNSHSLINIDRKPISTLNYNYSNNSIHDNNKITSSIINLLDSKSDKLLKNNEEFSIGIGNQKPINTYSTNNTSYSPLYNKSQIKKSQIYIVNSSTNQIVPADSLTNPNNFNANYKNQGNWLISPQLPLPNLSSTLQKRVIIQRIESLPEQSMQKQKQSMATPNALKKEHNLRTNPSFPSSQSFETENFCQNKIYQNFKNLQNKISQVVNQSVLHTQNKESHIKQRNIGLSSEIGHKNIKNSDIRASNYSSNNQKYHESQSKMIQSFILPKSQEASSHSTINVINQQIKQIKQNNKITKFQKHSPILVRQSDQPPTNLQKNQDRKKYSDSYQNQNENQDKSRTHSDISKDSVDFLNLNMSKQSSDDPKQSPNLSMQVHKKIQEQQKVQQVLTTPNKQPSSQRLQRLQGNNLTIPEQSDEQSIQQSSNPNEKIKGDYVEQVYENGGKYIGYMLNNQRNGNGIFYYRDGGYYDGRWKNNMMNGYGKLYYQTGKLAYQGQWYQDQFHGRGIVYNDQPQSVPDNGFDYRNMNESQNYWLYYQGDLSHDMKARYGKLTLSNGQYYEGEFKNDQIHGKGLFHRFDGALVKGIWSQGVFIKQL